MDRFKPRSVPSFAARRKESTLSRSADWHRAHTRTPHDTPWLMTPSLCVPTPIPSCAHIFDFLPQVFCGNFEYDARAREIERLFEIYGPIDRVEMKTGETPQRLGTRLPLCTPLVSFPSTLCPPPFHSLIHSHKHHTFKPILFPCHERQVVCLPWKFCVDQRVHCLPNRIRVCLHERSPRCRRCHSSP